MFEWKAQGDANDYCILRDGNWVAAVLMNGEMMPVRQEKHLTIMVDALNADLSMQSPFFDSLPAQSPALPSDWLSKDDNAWVPDPTNIDPDYWAKAFREMMVDARESMEESNTEGYIAALLMAYRDAVDADRARS